MGDAALSGSLGAGTSAASSTFASDFALSSVVDSGLDSDAATASGDESVCGVAADSGAACCPEVVVARAMVFAKCKRGWFVDKNLASLASRAIARLLNKPICTANRHV